MREAGWEGMEAYLEAEDFGLREGEGFAVDFDEAFALLNGCQLWSGCGQGIFERTLQCATAVAVHILALRMTSA